MMHAIWKKVPGGVTLSCKGSATSQDVFKYAYFILKVVPILYSTPKHVHVCFSTLVTERYAPKYLYNTGFPGRCYICMSSLQVSGQPWLPESDESWPHHTCVASSTLTHMDHSLAEQAHSRLLASPRLPQRLPHILPSPRRSQPPSYTQPHLSIHHFCLLGCLHWTLHHTSLN